MAGKLYSWKFSLTSKLFNLLFQQGEWKLLSENEEFVVCAEETGNSHIHKGIWFILSQWNLATDQDEPAAFATQF